MIRFDYFYLNQIKWNKIRHKDWSLRFSLGSLRCVHVSFWRRKKNTEEGKKHTKTRRQCTFYSNFSVFFCCGKNIKSKSISFFHTTQIWVFIRTKVWRGLKCQERRIICHNCELMNISFIHLIFHIFASCFYLIFLVNNFF